MNHNFLIHSSADGHLGCFHVLAIINSAVMRQQKRHRCIERTFGLWGRERGKGWDDLGEWHWNMYTIMWETKCQSMFDTGDRMLGDGAWGWSRGMISGGRWEGDSGLGARIHPWWIHVNVWQNQYSTVKQNKVKIKLKTNKQTKISTAHPEIIKFQIIFFSY